MSKNSPAPWFVHGTPYNRTVVYKYDNGDGLGERLGVVCRLGEPGNHDPIQLKDGHLIAAAPTMKDLVKEFLIEAKLVKAYTTEGSVYLHPNDFKPLTTKLITRAEELLASLGEQNGDS